MNAKARLVLFLYGLKLYISNLTLKLPSSTVRKYLLLFFGARLGQGVHIYGGLTIRSPKNLSVGNCSVVGERVLLDARKELYIGENVNISSEVMIWTLHHDTTSPTFDAIGNSVLIGDYAWICARAIILPGVKIGRGAVIGAGCVVSKDVGDYEIVVGNPQKVVGYRNNNLIYNLNKNIPFV